jgi:hypothetical protein
MQRPDRKVPLSLRGRIFGKRCTHSAARYVRQMPTFFFVTLVIIKTVNLLAVVALDPTPTPSSSTTPATTCSVRGGGGRDVHDEVSSMTSRGGVKPSNHHPPPSPSSSSATPPSCGFAASIGFGEMAAFLAATFVASDHARVSYVAPSHLDTSV